MAITTQSTKSAPRVTSRATVGNLLLMLEIARNSSTRQSSPLSSSNARAWSTLRLSQTWCHLNQCWPLLPRRTTWVPLSEAKVVQAAERSSQLTKATSKWKRLPLTEMALQRASFPERCPAWKTESRALETARDRLRLSTKASREQLHPNKHKSYTPVSIWTRIEESPNLSWTNLNSTWASKAQDLPQTLNKFSRIRIRMTTN